MLLAVNAGAVASPLAFVTTVAVADPLKEALAPVVGAANVTVIPLRRLFAASFTTACNGVPTAALIVPLCGVPAVAAILAGAPARFVKLKAALVATPVVLAVAVADPPKVPVGPELGAVKVTVTPLMGALDPLTTVACRAVPYAVVTAALWPVPALPVIAAGVVDDPASDRAAPAKLTFPEAVALTHVTVSVCPAELA